MPPSSAVKNKLRAEKERPLGKSRAANPAEAIPVWAVRRLLGSDTEPIDQMRNGAESQSGELSRGLLALFFLPLDFSSII